MRVSVTATGLSEDIFNAEILKGVLSHAGFQLGEGPDAVRVLAASGAASLPLLSPEKTLIAGTFSKGEMETIREKNEEVAFLGSHNLHLAREAIENLAQGALVDMMTESEQIDLHLPRIRNNPAIGLLQLHHSYLDTFISHPIEDVLTEAKKAAADGCKELTLLGDATRYGTEKIWSSSLPELLKALVEIPGNFKVRCESCGAKGLKPIIDEVMNWMAHEKAYKHLHLPLFSGSSEILDQMNAGFTVEEAKSLANRFKSEFGRGTFSTEFVVGFGEETVAQFNDSLQVLGELRPEMVSVSQAASGRMIDDRARILTNTFHHILRMNNEKWLGWQGELMMIERAERDEWTGRNFAWKPINVKGSYKPGDMVRAKANTIVGDVLRAENLR
ncbi:MAG: hypothetical protein Q7S65_05445 [Nanoarchaeota archaeon]|nr:hypothetical protein [Nanoarchaeota archaeon]